MMADLRPWPTLADFLDAGGDLSIGWPGAQRNVLIEDIYARIRVLPPLARERAVLVDTHWSEESVDQLRDRFSDDPRLVPTEAEHFAARRRHAWVTEMLADLDVTKRVIALLTPEERAKGERIADLYGRSFPYYVGLPHADWWQCDNCGTAFDNFAPALIVGDRSADDPDHRQTSELDEDIRYCRPCIARALAEFDRGEAQR